MKMIKRLLLLAAIMMVATVSYAYDVEVDGIYYNIVPKAKKAEVTSGDKHYVNSVTIPSTITVDGVVYDVTSIGENAFDGCQRLTSITIPNSVTSIGERAFSRCFDLTSITIPNSVTSIGDYAFWNCSGYSSGLTSITIPNSVTSIGRSAFGADDDLKDVHISDLKAWCEIDFYDGEANPLCYAQELYINDNLIDNLEIPSSVTSISRYAFCGYEGLTSVNIPNSVTSIGNSAFGGCKNLKSVEIPNSVTVINVNTFSGCSSLSSINLPNSINIIQDGAFFGCTSLTSMTFPNSISIIRSSAFSACNGLKSIIIPNSVKEIEPHSFANCKNLEKVYCYAKDVPMTGYSAFENSEIEYSTLYVPEASLDAYKTTEPWSSFGTIKSIESEGGVVEDGIWDVMTQPLLIQSVGNTLNLSNIGGEATIIEAYNTSGLLLDRTVSHDGKAQLCVSDEIVIVKVGNKSIKVKTK
ncbi:MAG: leucine-rich repeat domain-containing protein [Bacteroidaceae bacterium]|nr:leucine-rich repeat domain-containing protein [Bacteroidaceae bacterium]